MVSIDGILTNDGFYCQDGERQSVRDAKVSLLRSGQDFNIDA